MPPTGHNAHDTYISQCKRIYVKKFSNNIIKCRGEINYKNDSGVYRTIIKRVSILVTWFPKWIHVTKIPLRCQVNSAILTDVNKLLNQHYGLNWMENECLSYFKSLIIDPHPNNNNFEEYNEQGNATNALITKNRT